jgi:hypothetical protein
MKQTNRFKTIASHCEAQSEMCRLAIEEFLLYFAASRDGFSKEFDERLKPYRHVIDPGHVPGFKSQYIAHRIFKAGGTLQKYLKHTMVNQLPADQLGYLHEQGERPWRMCFSVVATSPAPDFYEMEDLLTGASFLLYSKGASLTLQDYPVVMWLNLIGWNGLCWQTFGPVTGFRSFGLDEIFYFATELNHRIESEEDIASDVERNPVPYMMLYSGSTLPMLAHRGQLVAATGAEHDLRSFESTVLKNTFRLDYNKGVYRATPRKLTDAFEFPEVYYDERRQTLFLITLTSKGFLKLVKRLNKLGFSLSTEPQFSVQLTMLETMSSMLRRNISANPYAHLFEEEPDPVAEAEMARINRAMDRALPEINAGRMPDVKALARETGLDEAALTKIFRDTLSQLRE